MIFVLLLLFTGVVYAGAADPKKAGEFVESEEGLFIDPFDDAMEDPFETDEPVVETVSDPLIGFNRAMFVVNDKLYFWVLKPVASGYKYIVPTPVRLGVKNFFFNLLVPVRLTNCLLQGKFKAAKGEFDRFLVNTIIGVGGLFNPAGDYPDLNPPEEDMGQTFGHYGVGNGFYIVWPVFGPSTVRDTIGDIGDWALNPFSFMKLVNVDAGVLTSDITNVVVYGARNVNNISFHIGDYEALKDAALDPYEAFRNAYMQNRKAKIAQ